MFEMMKKNCKYVGKIPKGKICTLNCLLDELITCVRSMILPEGRGMRFGIANNIQKRRTKCQY